MRFLDVSNLSPLALGAVGERFAQEQFEKAGYVVSIPTEKKAGDLRVMNPITGEVMRVEVKTGRDGVDGRWQFCITRRIGKRNKTDCHHADVVVVQAVSSVTGLVVTYVIPTGELDGQAIMRLSQAGSARSKWARFLSDYQIMEVNDYGSKVA